MDHPCRHGGTISGDPSPFFAYPALRRGHRHADRLRGARLLGEGWIRGRVVTHAGDPALVPGDGAVPGGMWAVSAVVWPGLDAFEEAHGDEHPRSVSVRRAAEVHTPVGSVRAWVYALHPRWRP